MLPPVLVAVLAPLVVVVAVLPLEVVATVNEDTADVCTT